MAMKDRDQMSDDEEVDAILDGVKKQATDVQYGSPVSPAEMKLANALTCLTSVIIHERSKGYAARDEALRTTALSYAGSDDQSKNVDDVIERAEAYLRFLKGQSWEPAAPPVVHDWDPSAPSDIAGAVR